MHGTGDAFLETHIHTSTCIHKFAYIQIRHEKKTKGVFQQREHSTSSLILSCSHRRTHVHTGWVNASQYALDTMWCSSWTSLHYKYIAATWIEPAFNIIHLAAWLSQPKQDIIAINALLLPACQPVKVPLVGLIKLDLIWNERCSLPCLSRPRVVIFISHSLSQIFHLFIYPSLHWVIAQLPSIFMKMWGSVQSKNIFMLYKMSEKCN